MSVHVFAIVGLFFLKMDPRFYRDGKLAQEAIKEQQNEERNGKERESELEGEGCGEGDGG